MASISARRVPSVCVIAFCISFFTGVFFMNKAGQTVCLCMIVKDENHILRRSLDSVRSLIDTWVIVDTGSTDGTQQLIQDYFKDLRGELFERPWKNFGHNRSESVALARGRADYLLLMDADEYLEAGPGYQWPQLIADAYSFQMHTTGIDYYRAQLIRSALPWRYEGVAHEYITCDTPFTEERLAGMRTQRRQEGARSRDPLVYRRDALLLEEAVLQEPSNARHMFYLAQSYRDCDEPVLAIDRYRRRIAMGGWAEEVWFSLYQIAMLQHHQHLPWPTVLDSYLQAVSFRPSRAEPLYRIGMYYMGQQQHAVAHLFLAAAMQLPYPAGEMLFVEWDVYQYLLPMEYAVACYWLTRDEEAIQVIDRLLTDPSLLPDRGGSPATESCL